MQSDALLTELDARRTRTRARAAAGWLPMLLTGLALLGTFPAYAGWWDGPPASSFFTSADPSLWERVNANITRLGGVGGRPLALYWLAVVPAVYGLSACWFAWNARRTGLRLRWGLHLLLGIGTFLVVLISALPPFDHWSALSSRPLLTPLLALALGLVALGCVEHDRALVAAGGAVGAVSVLVAALRHHDNTLADSPLGNIGQAALAPSVEVATVGLLLVLGSLVVRGAHQRISRSPAIALPAEVL